MSPRRPPAIPKFGRFFTVIGGKTLEGLWAKTFVAADEEKAFEAARKRGAKGDLYAVPFVPPAGFTLIPSDHLEAVASWRSAYESLAEQEDEG